MLRSLFALCVLCVSNSLLGNGTPLFEASALHTLPAAYEGRFRDTSAYADLWWYDLYHSTSIKKSDRPLVGADTPLDLLWKVHFYGHRQWDDAPILWIKNQTLKDILGLDPRSSRFSYASLKKASLSPEFLQTYASLEFLKAYGAAANRSQSAKLELKSLSEGLWVESDGKTITVIERPNAGYWANLPKGALPTTRHSLNGDDITLLSDMSSLLHSLQQFESLQGGAPAIENEYLKKIHEWQAQNLNPSEIFTRAEESIPLQQRLVHAGTTFKMLPSKRHKGEWYSLHALQLHTIDRSTGSIIPIHNFTLYSDALFNAIQTTYHSLNEAIKSGNTIAAQEQATLLGNLLREGYDQLAGTPILKSAAKTLYYPTVAQLKAEAFYYTFPLIELCLFLYGLALLCFLLNFKLHSRPVEWTATAFFFTAFVGHTFIVILRSFILNRPPVSNMFETVIYVPWIAVLLSLILRPFVRTTVLFIASSIVALALLVVLKISNVNSSMENVQAVLDSQYWLIIHVMMIVGSYGVFALSGILAHIYLTGLAIVKKETPWLKYTASSVLQTLYIGVSLLIPGTILGGVWAAQSWGRFWDWDPKESWAFISSCVYLIWIHAYRFRYIGHVGLAAGSIIGLMAISFTWYGVNYLLGTGLHSYGFGSGGDGYYYAYLLAEVIFIGITLGIIKNIEQRIKNDT